MYCPSIRRVSRIVFLFGLIPFWIQCSPFTPDIDKAAIASTKRTIWSQWTTALSEPFQDNRRRWLAGNINDAFAKGNITVGPDVYKLDLQAQRDVIYASTTGVFPVNRQAGFYLAIDAKKAQGPDSGYGLIFLYTQHPNKDRDHYYFELSDHEFRFAVRAKGSWHTIIGWTQSSLIQANQSNRLAVFVQGKQFFFFINDTYVADAEDETLADGRIGVGIELFQAKDAGVYEFDNYEVRTP